MELRQKIQSYITLTFALLLLICIVINYTEAKIGWTTYTDPYNRYSIKFPSKWTIETEPVHDATYSYEVPLKVNGHGSYLIVRDIGTMNGLSLREYASYYRSNEDQGSVLTSHPIICGSSLQLYVVTCSYGYTTAIGLIPVGTRVDLYSFSDKVFVVTFILNSEGAKLGTKNVNFIFDSFRLIGLVPNVDSTQLCKIGNNTWGDCPPSIISPNVDDTHLCNGDCSNSPGTISPNVDDTHLCKIAKDTWGDCPNNPSTLK